MTSRSNSPNQMRSVNTKDEDPDASKNSVVEIKKNVEQVVHVDNEKNVHIDGNIIGNACENTVESTPHNSDIQIARQVTGKVFGEFSSLCEQEWYNTYNEIRHKAEKYARAHSFTTIESEKNGRLNRYRDVHPYDHTRIVLKRSTNKYINANLVEVKDAGCKYILTQGPLKDTIGSFWLMIWEQNTRGILMLNKLVEKGQVKCHKYWPIFKRAQYALKFNDLKLNVELLGSEQYIHYEYRRFKLTDEVSKTSRQIVQYHYTTWPDFGVPEQIEDFLRFWKHVHDSDEFGQDVGPAVVHCSAGIGRSGTFCLIDACLTIFEKMGEDSVSVTNVLLEMRRSRMGLIQSFEQFVFSYKAIYEGIKMLQDSVGINYTPNTKMKPSSTSTSDSSTSDYTPNRKKRILFTPLHAK